MQIGTEKENYKSNFNGWSTQIYAGTSGPNILYKLTILLPTKKCKLYKIADLDKIVAPKLRVKLFGYEAPSDLLMYIYRFSFILLRF